MTFICANRNTLSFVQTLRQISNLWMILDKALVQIKTYYMRKKAPGDLNHQGLCEAFIPVPRLFALPSSESPAWRQLPPSRLK
jgi:hypothetical protein